MASLNYESNGSKNVRFNLPGETTRRKISLGKMNRKTARSVKTKIEDLIYAHIAGFALDGETSRWVAELPDDLYERIARTGILPKRERREKLTLKEATQKYYAMRQDAKASTRNVWEQGHDKLMEFLREDYLMADVSEVNAEEFEQWLIGKGYAAATCRKRIAVCKMLWKWAVKRGYAESNVFADLRSTAVPTKHLEFIPREDIERVIAACPNTQWKLLIAFARYAGLRIHSRAIASNRGVVAGLRGSRCPIRS